MNKKKFLTPIFFLIILFIVCLTGCVSVETEEYDEVSGHSVRLYGKAYLNEFYTGNPSSCSDVKFKFGTSWSVCQDCESYRNSVDVSREDFSKSADSVSFNALVSGLRVGERYYFRACALYYPNEPDDPVYIGGDILSFKFGSEDSLIVIELPQPSIIELIETLNHPYKKFCKTL